MDFIGSAIRSGVTGFRSSYRISRRRCLENIYSVKELYFEQYDNVRARLCCKRRGRANLLMSAHVPGFYHDTPLMAAERRRRSAVPVYDFTDLQHGIASKSELLRNKKKQA
eukprot:gnl/TRDRNA2_/TRDRNA2_196000_c0_seq1.p1 gnl/TRDRNA2_/TRDRNA2_196000_c0~~gnl/TRDRNA2_/TRDRNA2_196000_c0_seq1.p1  ORF type:complete len:111 (+),score=19.58 gnl/TRDRNA2_/TRDRNA2_196000_c0_seq1:75-407(+)